MHSAIFRHSLRNASVNSELSIVEENEHLPEASGPTGTGSVLMNP
jgi:hypothetical protein